MKRYILAMALALMPATALAVVGEKRECKEGKVLFDEVVLNGAAGTRTKIMTNLLGYDKVRLSVQYTHASNGTLTFVITSRASDIADTATAVFTGYQQPTSTTCAGAICTLTIGKSVVTPVLTAATDFDFYLNLDGETDITIVATESTATAAEKLTISYQKCVAGGQ